MLLGGTITIINHTNQNEDEELISLYGFSKEIEIPRSLEGSSSKSISSITTSAFNSYIQIVHGGPFSPEEHPESVSMWNSCGFLNKNFGVQTVLTNNDGDRINIRSGPGPEYTAINAGNPNDLVDVLQEGYDTKGCKWVEVRFGTGVEGWIRGDLLNADY